MPRAAVVSGFQRQWILANLPRYMDMITRRKFREVTQLINDITVACAAKYGLDSTWAPLVQDLPEPTDELIDAFRMGEPDAQLLRAVRENIVRVLRKAAHDAQTTAAA